MNDEEIVRMSSANEIYILCPECSEGVMIMENKLNPIVNPIICSDCKTKFMLNIKIIEKCPPQED